MSTISDMELDHILSTLEKDGDEELRLEDVGSRVWCSKMSMFEEINVQAALEAASGEDHIWRSSSERGALSSAVREMLRIEIWREEVLSRMLEMQDGDDKDKSVLQVYMILFYEVNLANLLETTLFNADACRGISDQALDLTDYCVRHLVKLLAESEVVEEQDEGLARFKEESIIEEMKRHDKTTEFQVGEASG